MRRERMAWAALVASGAMMTSVNSAAMCSARSASSVRFSAMMPPNAETGSQRRAACQALSRVGAEATPQGLACLTMTMVGAVNSATQA